MLFAILAHYQNAQNDVEIVSYRQKKEPEQARKLFIMPIRSSILN